MWMLTPIVPSVLLGLLSWSFLSASLVGNFNSPVCSVAKPFAWRSASSISSSVSVERPSTSNVLLFFLVVSSFSLIVDGIWN